MMGGRGGKGGRVVKEHGESQKGVVSRVGGGDGSGWGEWWRENGDNVLEQQFKKRKKIVTEKEKGFK